MYILYLRVKSHDCFFKRCLTSCPFYNAYSFLVAVDRPSHAVSVVADGYAYEWRYIEGWDSSRSCTIVRVSSTMSIFSCKSCMMLWSTANNAGKR